MINLKKKYTYKQGNKEKEESVMMYTARGKLPSVFQESLLDRMSKNPSNTGLGNILENYQVQWKPLPSALCLYANRIPWAFLSSVLVVRHSRNSGIAVESRKFFVR